MKRNLFFLFFSVSIVLASCNKKADKETVDKMADEVCKAMELIVDEDPMSVLEGTSALLKIQENTEEYGKVTNEQLIPAIEEKCPSGAEKYKKLVTEGEEPEE